MPSEGIEMSTGDVVWNTRALKDNKVLLTGRVRLPCGHTVQDSAQVHNRDAAIEQGKRTVRNLLHLKIQTHMRDEHGE